MIIFIDRAKPVTLKHSLLGRCRALGLALKQTFSSGPGGGLMVQRNVLRELQLQDRFFWVAGCDAEPLQSVTDAAWVLSSKRDFARALDLKRKGKVRRLWAGPNITVVPQEARALFEAPELDACIVPCGWVADIYAREMPALKGKLTVWPVGIDTGYWKNNAALSKKEILIYDKQQPELTREVLRLLTTLNMRVRVITYGAYAPEAFCRALNEAWGMIWLSRSESQGLAYLEALSANVPVLAWDCGEWRYKSKTLGVDFTGPASSVPYFDASCGQTFKTLDEFLPAFAHFKDALPTYAPHAFIVGQKLTLAANLDRLDPLLRLA